MGGALGSISANLASVTKGMQLTPIMQQALSQIAQSGDQRAAFNAILLATAANVTKKPNFNLELEINDLWIRLGNLRSAQPAGVGGVFANLGKTAALVNMNIGAVLGDLESAVLNLAKNVK